jgi:hypothetical protein
MNNGQTCKRVSGPMNGSLAFLPETWAITGVFDQYQN